LLVVLRSRILNTNQGEHNISDKQQPHCPEMEDIDFTVQDEDPLDQGPHSSLYPPDGMPGGWYLIHDDWKLDTDQLGNLIVFRYNVMDGKLVPS